MKTDPVEDSAHPSGTHGTPGAADRRGAGETDSGEEEIASDGRNPTQRKIDGEKESEKDKPVTPPTAG